MPYREHPPSTSLRGLVDCFWSAVHHAPIRVLPDGCVDILFSFGSEPGASVVGVMTRAVFAEGATEVPLLGVRFRPGAALSALGIAGHESRDGDFALSELWGADGRALEELVVRARTHEARVRAIESALLARRPSSRAADLRVARAVAKIEDAGGNASVASIAGATGVSERQLERLFDDHLGLRPKFFARVVRLQTAVKRAQQTNQTSATLAAECGYADQAHMIREFDALAGATPRELLEERAVSDSFNPAPPVGARLAG
jgi:AraC-like DNA-binding protein